LITASFLVYYKILIFGRHQKITFRLFPHTAFFTRQLFEWYDPDRRPTPWKGEEDPYRIWLSEIILQQTRVEQGWPYFEAFVTAYPTVHHLAAAPQDEVMKKWEGLGYYNRARNMLAAARYISDVREGKFPDNYEDILALKGVGPYTAAAIASFAYNLPYAVVDGNVYRVLARFFGIDHPTNTTSGKKLFTELAQTLLDKDQPGTYNQAIMDFGALVCTPANPDCASCPLQIHCKAHRENRIDQLPHKQPKAPRRIRFFHYFLLNHDGKILLRKREHKDVWRGLYEFPLLETEKLLEENQLLQQHTDWPFPVHWAPVDIAAISPPKRQLLSHQDIRARFIEIHLPKSTDPATISGTWVDREVLSDYAFPRIIDWYLGDNSLYLNM
jgi:A/G-specific adenine glycosylase